MGWAQRAKQEAMSVGAATRRGNPAPYQPMATVISAEKFDAAIRRGERVMRVTLGGRQYVMNHDGQLRRVRLQPAATVRITEGPAT